MTKNHFPGANTTSQYWAGKFNGSTMNTNCACIHTTETSVRPGYGGGASAPHMTILPNIKAQTVSIRQHFPAGKSSRALVNLSGGVETNTLNVFQIELIGTCDSRYRVSRKEWGVAGVDYIYWPDAPDWLLEAIAPVFRWLDAEWPNFKIVDATPRGWVQYPASYGVGARQRMTFAEWRNAYGIFGHQHVPENTHGDPGNFPIDRLVAIAKGSTTVPPKPPVVTPPKPAPVLSEPHKYISANLAGYNKPYGIKTAESRARNAIPDYLLAKKPLWFHFQECSAPMLDDLDKELKGYHRLSAGGKGRESYFREGQGVKVFAAELQNVTHMLRKDTKEFLLIAWRDAEGFEGVYCNFHNENEGSSFQVLQLRDVMTAARKFADKHGIDRANIVITGDSNLPSAVKWVWAQRWAEARHIAKKKIDLIYKTTNGWKAWNRGGLVKGSPIDIDVFQRDAIVDEAEMLFGLIADHWAHRVIHRLKKKK